MLSFLTDENYISTPVIHNINVDNISLIKFFIKMKRQLTSILLFSALLVSGASAFVSCTDHDSDNAYNTSVSLADAIAAQKASLEKINEELAKKANAADVAKEKEAILARISANEDAIKNLDLSNYVTYGELNAAIEASQAYVDLKNLMVDGLSTISGSLNSIYAAVEELRSQDSAAFVKLDSALQAQIDILGNRATSLENMQSQIKMSLDNLKKSMDYLVNNNLSSIVIDGTENPVTGAWNAAFMGSQLNLVSAYYGRAAEGNQAWGVKADQLLGKNGNAGYIYVTLNPTQIDKSLITEIKLVDSQGNEAKGFKLGNLEDTDKVLTYGYSRAGSDNGFYAIPVTCVDPENDDFSLDKDALKQVAKNVLAKLKNPSKTNLQVSQIASTLYNNFNNQLKAYKVEATFYLYDATTGKMVKRTVKGATSMAAFAVKPVSYNFLKGNQKIENLSLDRYMLPTLSDKFAGINAIDFSNIIDPDTNTEIEVATIIAVPGVTLEQDGKNVKVMNNGNVIQTLENATIKSSAQADKDITIDVDDASGSTTLTTYIYKVAFKDNTLKDLISSINDGIAGKLGPLNDAIATAKTYTTKYDNVASKVNSLIKRIENSIHDVNKLLQPAMLYEGQDGNFYFVSTGNKFGTAFTGTGATTLIATSYTNELLAPAYKKSFYVKESGAEILVDGKVQKEGDICLGETRKIVFNAEKAGTYTVVYKAIDYSGIEVETNFYITVK